MMSVAITASRLRSDVYNILDRVIETGEEVVIERNGKRLVIAPAADERRSKLDRLVPHPGYVVGDSSDLVEMDWSDEWHADPL